MSGARQPHMLKEPGSNRRLTVLDCEVGQHSGHFAIRRVKILGEHKWGCEDCIAEMAAGLWGAR